MALAPISFIAINYRDYKNYWLKVYEPGTTTPKVMALESNGGTQVIKLQINADGFLVSAGQALVIPYIDNSYDAWIFPTEAEADNNDTSNALRVADDMDPSAGGGDGEGTTLKFDTVSEMVDGGASFLGITTATTINNNNDTFQGGATYEIMTIADYVASTVFTEPDGEIINGLYIGSDWYLEGNTNLVARRIQDGPDINPYEFGYRGIGVTPNEDPDIPAVPDPTKDESDVLDKIYAYIQRGAAIDIGGSSLGKEHSQKGRYNIRFPVRSICNISRPIPYFTNRTSFYGNNTEIRPINPITVFSTYGSLDVMQQIHINYSTFVTDEQVYEQSLLGNYVVGFDIMAQGDPDVTFDLEQFTRYSQIVVTGGWNAFRGGRGGILFGIDFDSCKSTDPLSHGFDLGDNTNITTTCTFSKPFVRLTKRAKVQHNGYVWQALRHMGASEPQEPPATPDNSEYWQVELDSGGTPITPTTEDAWVSGTFYRAFGKHYRLINMSTLSMENPSGDGGTDVEPIFEFSGINCDIDNYHLEKHVKVFSDRETFSVLSGQLTMGCLYLAENILSNEGVSDVQVGGNVYNCYKAHTSDASNAPDTGADWAMYWTRISQNPTTQPNWVTGTDYTTGDATYLKAANPGGRGISIDSLEQKVTSYRSGRVKAVDGENSNERRVFTGKGISPDLLKNMGGHIALSGVVKPLNYHIPQFSALSTFTIRPNGDNNGALMSSSLAPTGNMIVEIDGTLPVGTLFGFEVYNGTGGQYQSAGKVTLEGINGSFFYGTNTVENGVIWCEKVGSNTDGVNPTSWRTWTEGLNNADQPINLVDLGFNNHILHEEYAGKTVWINDTVDSAAVIQTDAAALLPNNTTMMIMQEGTGLVSITASSGVLLNGVNGGTVELSRYGGATIIKRGDNSWVAAAMTVES